MTAETGSSQQAMAEDLTPAARDAAAFHRVHYAVNPLKEVVFQIQFPLLLAIQTSAPSGFQRDILSNFPYLEEQVGFTIVIGPQTPNIQQEQATKSFVFTAQDRKFKTTLTSSFLSVSTSAYSSWEHFRSHIEKVVPALLREYALPIRTRTGLRYVNLLERKLLKDGEQRNWSDYVTPALASIFTDGLIKESVVKQAYSHIQFTEVGATVSFQHGIVNAANTSEKSYLIDIDAAFAEERPFNLENTLRDAEELHNMVGPLFRRSISNELHHALRPAPIKG